MSTNPSMASPVKDMPINTVREIYEFFHEPAHVVQIQVASDKTLYAWQNMSGFFYTQQVLRDGPISELPERIVSKIGNISFTLPNGQQETVDQHFNESNMDALLVLHQGNIVFERYKTMRPFDKHNWFSSGKVIASTLVALLEYEGKIDVTKPVSDYVPQLKNSDWDIVTVEETLDMATGLDSTEHEEPNDDARVNPIRGWYKWAVSIGVFEDTDGLNQTPYQVMRNMKRVKPGHTAFEYNSIDTFVLELIVNEITGQPLSEVFSERIWRKIGAQNDAYIGVTKWGLGNSWGFMNSTLRDFGRFGMLFTPSWNKISHEQIIPDALLQKIQTGGRPDIFLKGFVGKEMQAAFPDIQGLTNRYQWDVIFPDGDMYKAGVGGQGLYISPARDVVLVWFCTGKQQEQVLARAIAQSL